jgi:hypothetical protein
MMRYWVYNAEGDLHGTYDTLLGANTVIDYYADNYGILLYIGGYHG